MYVRITGIGTMRGYMYRYNDFAPLDLTTSTNGAGRTLTQIPPQAHPQDVAFMEVGTKAARRSLRHLAKRLG